MLDLILRNGRVVDGTGNPWLFADVGIKDGVVVQVGKSSRKSQEMLPSVEFEMRER